MISNFNEEAEEILMKAKLEMLELKHPYVGTEHLLLAILHTKNELSKSLEQLGLTYQKFKKEILNIIGKGSKKSDFFLHTPLLKKVIETAIMDSKDNNNGLVTENHLFISLLDIGEGIAVRILTKMNLNIDELYEEFTSKLINNNQTKKKLLIEELGINLNNKVINNEIDPLYGREKEIQKIEEILCRRTKNNPLLIGPPGTGKTAIVEWLAFLIENNQIPPKLAHKTIYALDMATAVSGTKYRGEFEERIKKIINEIEENDNIILFIDEIHTLVGAGGAEGAIDAANIFKPALARGKIKCIGATTNDEYKKSIEKDRALERRFQKVTIEEPSIEETKNILKHIKSIYESYHNVIIEDHIIDTLTDLTEKYIYNRYRPDKQIDILDEVCSKVTIKNVKSRQNLAIIQDKKELYIKENNIKKAYEYKIKETKYKSNVSNKKKKINLEDIANIISNKSKIPIYEILKDNKKSIQLIEKKLSDTIIGQNEVIKKLMTITKRIKFGYKENKCLSLLFAGPSGVGKTSLAEIYGNIISNNHIIKIDMNDFADSQSISKFIGAGPGYIGYDNNKYILDNIKDNPNAVIIFDEIEKAHSKMIDLILQIISEGKIKDAKNNLINLNNNIIIIISNSLNNIKSIGFNSQNNSYYELPIASKVNYILNFNQLSNESIITIINQKINELKNKYKEVKLDISKKVINEIKEEIKYQEKGVYTINQIIKNKIEDYIIDQIIENNKHIIIDSLFSK